MSVSGKVLLSHASFFWGLGLIVGACGSGIHETPDSIPQVTQSSNVNKADSEVPKVPALVAPEVPTGIRLPAPLTRIRFGMTRTEVQRANRVFGGRMSAQCENYPELVCGFETPPRGNVVERLFFESKSRAVIDKLTQHWPKADAQGQWIDLDKKQRAVLDVSGEKIRIDVTPFISLEALIGVKGQLFGFEKNRLIRQKKRQVAISYKSTIEHTYKRRKRRSGRLATQASYVSTSRPLKSKVMKIRVPSTELSELPIYVRPSYHGPGKRVSRYSFEIPYGKKVAAATRVFTLFEQKYGAGVDKEIEGRNTVIYGQNPKIFVWNNEKSAAVHVKVVDGTDKQGVRNSETDACMGFSGRWRGQMSGGTITQTHYLVGHVYARKGRCYARFRTRFARTKGSGSQAMVARANGRHIRLRGTRWRGAKNYRGVYSLDTFYLSLNKASTVLRGRVQDRKGRRGRIVLRRV